MSPRPRKASDAEVFAAAGRVMARVGPAQLTLAQIAGEAGLTAGALVQRFGSKRELLVALSNEFAASTPVMFTDLRKANTSPLATLRAYADCIAEMGSSPGALAHHLSYLQADITDPDLRRHLRDHARASRASIRGLLAEAVAQGELTPGTDLDSLARVAEVTINGSLMTWAFYQDGTAREFIRNDLDAALKPYLPAGGRPRAREAPPARRRAPRR